MKKWFYKDRDQEVGPFSDAEIMAIAYSGNVQMTTLVWRAGFESWIPYEQVAQVIRLAIVDARQENPPAAEDEWASAELVAKTTRPASISPDSSLPSHPQFIEPQPDSKGTNIKQLQCPKCHNWDTYEKKGDGHWYSSRGGHGGGGMGRVAAPFAAAGMWGVAGALIGAIIGSGIGRGNCAICHEGFRVPE